VLSNLAYEYSLPRFHDATLVKAETALSSLFSEGGDNKDFFTELEGAINLGAVIYSARLGVSAWVYACMRARMCFSVQRRVCFFSTASTAILALFSFSL